MGLTSCFDYSIAVVVSSGDTLPCISATCHCLVQLSVLTGNIRPTRQFYRQDVRGVEYKQSE